MIAPLSNNDLGNGMHVVLRFMNSLSKLANIKFGRRIAAFRPLVESHSRAVNASCEVRTGNSKGNETRFRYVINPKLDHSTKDSVLTVLSEFEDVFKTTLGHTNGVTHSTDAGNCAPIKNHPCCLPYAYRDGAGREIKDMLVQGITQLNRSPGQVQLYQLKNVHGNLGFASTAEN